MPTTSLGITYPASTGHTRLWEHMQTLAEDVDDVITGQRAWTTWTPSWTAVTTNPAIGNGVLQGRWRYQTPSTVEVYVTLRPGSTTTFGSGAYRISLPVDAVSGGPDVVLHGSAFLGSPLYPLMGWATTATSAASFVTIYRSNVTTESLASFTATAPATFANGHSVSLSGSYRVAW